MAVFGLDAERRAALADALSWHISRRFQADELDAEAVLELRQAGMLADRLDEHRGIEGMSPVRLNADQVRLLIEAAWAYIAERDIETYQPPEERDRLALLAALTDPLFDLLGDLDRADEVLRASSF